VVIAANRLRFLKKDTVGKKLATVNPIDVSKKMTVFAGGSDWPMIGELKDMQNFYVKIIVLIF